MNTTKLHPDTYLGATLGVFIMMILALLAVYPGIFSTTQTTTACTEEAKVCADGSIVTRGGDACKFAYCPSGEGTLRPSITEEPFEVPISPPTTPEKEQNIPKKTTPAPKGVMCTMEVKLCSDGSFVGRVAPTCDFAPCPDSLEYESDH